MKRLFNQNLWEEYCEKVERDFKLKTYPHLDPYFQFPEQKEKLYTLLSDPTLSLIKRHDFLPLVKILQKTPRYRYQHEEDNFELETKIRPISFASHFDNYIYGFYSFCLNKLYQKYIHCQGFEETVLAYRTDLDGKCNIQFAKEIFDQIKNFYSEKEKCSVIALDIKGYFDHIDHKILKKRWCEIIDEDDLPEDQYSLYKSLTKYSYINYRSFLRHFNINLKKLEKANKKIGKKGKLFNSILDLIPDNLNGSSFKQKMNLLRQRNLITRNQKQNHQISEIGIPQGSAMSALLSNVYLSNFDKKIFEKGKKEGFIYRRYCDDLLIVCQSDKVNDLKNFVMRLIKEEYHLTIQDKKTEVIDFKISKQGKIRSFKRAYESESKIFLELENENKNFKNLQYLGFEFNGQNIYIRPGSVSRYFRKMKARIVKSISMAYSKNSKENKVYKSQILKRYSHLGNRNFLTYAYNASKKSYFNSKGDEKEGMNSPAIRKQISRHMDILKLEIDKTIEQKEKSKRKTKRKS